MKVKKLNKKLALRKRTLANLDMSQMTSIKGGATLAIDTCVSEFCTSGTPMCEGTAECLTDASITWCEGGMCWSESCTWPPICE